MRRGPRIGVLLAGVLLSALGCWPPDEIHVPHDLRFSNQTESTIAVVHQAPDGHEVVLAADIAPRGTSYTDLNKLGDFRDLCWGGDYVARDPTGVELGRHTERECDSWMFVVGPIPFTILNDSKLPLTIVFLGPPVTVVANTILPGAKLESTIQGVGDPYVLCSGYLVARTVVGREVARRPITGCNDWTWKIHL